MRSIKQNRLSPREERRRRLRAVALFKQGYPPIAAAHDIGVAPQTAYRWFNQWKTEGCRALLRPTRPGSRSKISADQLQRIETLLLKGPQAYGFRTSRWTLALMAHVIRRQLGISYSTGRLRQILLQLGWRHRKADPPPTLYAERQWLPSSPTGSKK